MTKKLPLLPFSVPSWGTKLLACVCAGELLFGSFAWMKYKNMEIFLERKKMYFSGSVFDKTMLESLFYVILSRYHN